MKRIPRRRASSQRYSRLGIILIILIAGFILVSSFHLKTKREPPYFPTCIDCNLILISIDTLRADHLGAYGYERNTSPNLDAFSENAYLFLNAYAQAPETLESFSSMFTSRYPPLNGLQPTDYTLAKAFQERGYKTGAFTDGGMVSREFGFDNGFDSFDDSGHAMEMTFERAENWLSENHDEKFFLWLHSYEVHSSERRWPLPFGETEDGFRDAFRGSPGNFTGCFKEVCGIPWLVNYPRLPVNLSEEELEYIVSLYDEQILYVDYYFQKIRELLEELEIDNNTVIIFHSDHGEEFLEKGMFFHGTSLYNSLLHVPLIIRVPGSEGAILDYPVELTDVFPTLTDIFGLQGEIGGAVGVNLFDGDRTRAIQAFRGRDFGEVTRMRWIYGDFILDVVELPCEIESDMSCLDKLIQSREGFNVSMDKENGKLSFERELDPHEFRLGEGNQAREGFPKRYFFRFVTCDNKTWGLRILNMETLHGEPPEAREITDILDSLACSQTGDGNYHFLNISFNLPSGFVHSRIPPMNDISTDHYQSILIDGKKLIVNGNTDEVEAYDILNDQDESIRITDPKLIQGLLNRMAGDKMEYENRPGAWNVGQETYERLRSLGYIS